MRNTHFDEVKWINWIAIATFSPVWVRRWHCRSELRGNRASQNSQANGLSPVWRRIWTVRFDEFEKLRPQYEHKCLLTTSRSSTGTWTRICDLKMKRPSRIIHFNGENSLSPYLRLSVLEKRFLQMSQVNFFGRGIWVDLCASNCSGR